jgi:DNA mismatch repair protein MutS2
MGVQPTRKPTFPELHLRRLTVEEALYRMDKYLDASFMANCKWIRIVHGKGTGKIREVVWDYLAKNALVKSFELAPYGQGDTGVTIVELYPMISNLRE